MKASPFDEEYEMNPTQESGADLRALLTAATSDGPAATDLLGAVRRSQRRRRIVVPAASLATAGALGAAALVVFSFGDTPTARAQVVAAAERTAGQGFTVHIVSGPGQAIYNGAFEPARQLGRMTMPGGGETRYLGNLAYVENVGPKAQELPAGKHWIVLQAPRHGMEKMPAAIRLIKLAPQDPQQALQQLRSATDVRDQGRASGPGWSGRHYTFTVVDVERGPGKPGARPLRATGSIDVDGQGRVRRVDLTLQDDGMPAGAAHTVMDFGDFGAHVTVSAPPSDQVISVDELPDARAKGTHPAGTGQVRKG